MATPMIYGDISNRTAAHAVAKMLTRGAPHLVIEKFGQQYQMPTKQSRQGKWRRYNHLALATTPLVEGVTPSGSRVVVTDVTSELEQYGDFVPFSDQVEDFSEDPFLDQLTQVLGEQAAQTKETLSYNVLKGGTNVFYSAGSAITDVDVAINLTMQRRVTRALKRQNAMHITNPVSSSASFRTEPIEAAFIALCHTDVESDVRRMEGFISTKQYGTVTPWQNEIGAVEDCRYLRSTIFTPFADSGELVATTPGFLSTTGTRIDVYPIIYLAKDAYGIVSLKGKNNLSIMVVNPKAASGDPLGQRGTAGWKFYHACVILNDAWMARAMVAVTA